MKYVTTSCVFSYVEHCTVCKMLNESVLRLMHGGKAVFPPFMMLLLMYECGDGDASLAL